MTVSVNVAIAGVSDSEAIIGSSGTTVSANVNVLIAGGDGSGAVASPSLDFSDAQNSMYLFPMTGIGVN